MRFKMQSTVWTRKSPVIFSRKIWAHTKDVQLCQSSTGAFLDIYFGRLLKSAVRGIISIRKTQKTGQRIHLQIFPTTSLTKRHGQQLTAFFIQRKMSEPGTISTGQSVESTLTISSRSIATPCRHTATAIPFVPQLALTIQIVRSARWMELMKIRKLSAHCSIYGWRKWSWSRVMRCR